MIRHTPSLHTFRNRAENRSSFGRPRRPRLAFRNPDTPRLALPGMFRRSTLFGHSSSSEVDERSQVLHAVFTGDMPVDDQVTDVGEGLVDLGVSD